MAITTADIHAVAAHCARNRQTATRVRDCRCAGKKGTACPIICNLCDPSVDSSWLLEKGGAEVGLSNGCVRAQKLP